ncbi:hypothetical protein JQ609_21400 [Bradyrhizobium sp. AUGA SZCCT0169]|uniref:hypothetical protein n=1 Tax=Bradyrhizobium sp. AUGA SZCCT0169 TaxID=2807663 RepID=UPI001BAC7496|nr:hypothetical protein [Bradyrhizobium sp. AUGA SZCCT0169]MBR1249473.1 hypothetical protein [Bradyrhizobium sp. AUGA SZCCT0169]
MPRLIFFTIHSTTPWWKYLGSRIDFADVTVLSDLRGEGDRSLVDDFYRFMAKGDAAAAALARFGDDGCADIILRCRVLRSIDRALALRMIGGMTQAIERALDELDPDLVMTFTIDRYVMDVMARTARARGIDFLEMTTSIIPDEVMLMRRGRPIWLREPSNEQVEAAVNVLCKADFAPAYVRDAKRFSTRQFWRVVGYYAVRGAFFNLWRFLKRDRFNIHYLDALKRLKHKVRFGDVAALKLLDRNWESRLGEVPRERRVFLGLQLFPEASMDYWLKSPDMLAHDDVLVRYCEVLGEAGYRIFVKDHPLQFGFRQRELFERLSKLPFVTLVPYDVPANLLIEKCGVSVTFTGTIGFQAALAGLCSVATDPYYATEDHFLQVRNVEEIGGLVDRLKRWRLPDDMVAARREIIRHLASVSVEGDYFGWRKFDPKNHAACEAVEPLARSLNVYLPKFLKSRKPAT